MLKFLLNRYRLQVGIVLIVAILVGGGALALVSSGPTPPEIEKIVGTTTSFSEPNETTASSTLPPVTIIKVDVSGAIANPGVYKLSEGGRVEDALGAAGGLSERADRDWVSKNLNLAAKLSDGDKLYIPKVGETETTAVAPTSSIPQNVAGVVSGAGSSDIFDCSRVNINTASADTLDECLSGIGPTYAQNIIDYRESHGGFKSIGEIQEVRGIGPKTFEKIKDQITVD